MNLALLLSGGNALCTTYVQVGVTSNLLIADGKVYFAQVDHTLTALNLDTGEVVARKMNALYCGTLRLFDNSILVYNYRYLTMLDRTTLDVIWQVEDESCEAIEGNMLLSCDDNGFVNCRELETGKIDWSYNFPYGIGITAQMGKVLLFHSAEYDGPEGVPAIVLLDIASGEEILHKTTPPNVHYLEAYFDGEQIYLPTGSYRGPHTPNLTRYDTGRSSARFEHLTVWDLAGEEVASIPVPDDFMINIINTVDRDEPFTIDGKVFARGQVWDRPEDVPPWRAGSGHLISEEMDMDAGKKVTVTRFDLADGSVTVTTTMDYGPGYQHHAETTTEVELKSASGNWRGNLPYLRNLGKVEVVAATDEKILLGTDAGHVEAINRSDGQSQWIYMFPTMCQIATYSTNSMPSMMATAATMYQRQNQHRQLESGFLLEGASQPSRPKVRRDPKPANPFRYLPRYLALAWTCVSVPVLLTAIIILFWWRKQWDTRIPAASGLVLAIGTIYGFFLYGRVSIATAIGFRFAIAVPLVVATVYAVRSMIEKRHIIGTLILLSVAALGAFIFPSFLRL